MNTERMVLKGQLADLKMEKMELATAISAKIKAAKSLLAGAAITPIEKIDVQGASLQLREAAGLKQQYAEICEKIRTVEAELA